MDSQKVLTVPHVESSKTQNHQQQQTATQVLQQQLEPPQCNICGTTQKLLRCAKCKAIYYCSTDHQHLDWPTHKKECRTLAKQRQINNRLQQLTTDCGAININVHSNALNTSSNVATNWPSNCTTPTYGNHHLQQLQNLKTPLLGSNENEILNSIAETVQQNSTSSEYVGNFDANSTTHDQMHNIMMQSNLDSSCGIGLDNQKLYHDNSFKYYQTMSTQVQKGELDQALLKQNEKSQYSVDTNLAMCYKPTSTQDEQQQHTANSLQQQPLQQQRQQSYLQQPPVPQLSNYFINQYEKSSSYQIGAADIDEIFFENSNERRYEELCRNIINDMNQYGLSVVDDFLGREKGLQILNEVHKMYSAGVFKDGQLVNNMKSDQDLRTIRGDKITWVKGVEPGCTNVGYLINQIDAVICRANSMINNGKLGNYVIKERTKAMIACYPGYGSHYVMHVDNPNKDGRVVTAIYYLNLNWDYKHSGGVLRIFPEQTKSVADIEPKFDRLIFFWSDKRNPHEVQPAHRTRYAITVWYFDANEREQALNRCKNSQNSNKSNNSNCASTSKLNNSSASTTDTTQSSNTASLAASSISSANSPAPTDTLSDSTLSNNTPSILLTMNDNLKTSAATTTNSTQNFSRPIQVVRPNSYK